MEGRPQRIHYTSEYTFAQRDASKAGGAEGVSARLGGFAFHQKTRKRMRIVLRASFVMERKTTQLGWPK